MNRLGGIGRSGPSDGPAVRWIRTSLVWMLVIAGLVGSIAALRLAVVRGLSVAHDLPFVVASLGMVSVGALIVVRRPGNVIGWLLAIAGGSGGVITWIDHYVPYSHAGPGEPSALAVWVAWFGTWSWVPVIVPIFFFLPLLFPDGRLPSPRWRPVVWAGVALVVVQVAVEALRPGPMQWGPDLRLANNPLGVEALAPYVDVILTAAGFAAMPVITLVVLVAPVVRWRRSRGVEHQQMKWLVAAGALLAGFVPLAFLELLPPEPLGVAFSLVILSLPVAIGMAVLRYRLYDIDRIISRTVAYALLTAVLVGVYGAVILLLGSLVGRGSDLAVAGATLAAAALFRPVRGRVQALVDRRFNRAGYDAQRTVAAFASRLRDEIDLDEISCELVGAVHIALQPAGSSLWIRQEVPR